MHIIRSGTNKIEIKGDIKGVADSLSVKEVIDEMVHKGEKTIYIEISDSVCMTSALIGHLLHVVKREKVALRITPKSSSLYEILEELGLVELFGVSKV